MSPKEVEREGTNLTHLPQDNVQWWAVVKMAVNIQVKSQEIASSAVPVPSYLSVIASLKNTLPYERLGNVTIICRTLMLRSLRLWMKAEAV